MNTLIRCLPIGWSELHSRYIASVGLAMALFGLTPKIQAARAATVAFGAEGQFEWVWDKGTQPSKVYWFKVMRQNDRWGIEVSSSNVSDGHLCFGSDGKDVYSLQTFKPESFTESLKGDTNNLGFQQKLVEIEKGLDYQPATVYPGPIPQSDPLFGNLVWLAFCSSSVASNIASAQGRMPASAFSYVSRGTNDSCKVIPFWGGRNESMLSSIFMLGANHYKTKDGAWIFPPPYDKQPYTNFAFSVITWTNLQDVVIPLTFRMSWFSLDLNAPNTPVRSPYHIDGQVTSAHLTRGEVTGIPKITRRMSVKDYRARPLYGVAGITYGTDPRKGWLAPTSSAYRNIARGLPEDGVRTNVRLLFLLFACFLSITYLVLIMKRLGLKSRKQQTNQCIRLLLPGFLLAVFVLYPSFFDASVHAGEIFDEISNSGLADRNVTNALDVLRSQVNKTRRELPPGMTNEFEQSIAARLKIFQESVSQNISKEYKSALMAKRILELSEQAMTLPYRKIPENAQQRKEAQEQYAAVLDRFEKLAPDRIRGLHEVSSNIISGALRQILTDVQHDIFQAGYGRPLSDNEKLKLNGIVDGMLQAAADLSRASDKKGTQASGLREASKVAHDGRKAVFEFLRGRETGLANNRLALVAEIWTRSSEIATLEKAVDRNLESADRVEIAALMENTHRQGEKDLQENDPKKIEAAAKATRPTASRPSRIAIFSVLFVTTIVLSVLAIRYKLKG